MGKMKVIEPASVNYFFRDGYIDLLKTIQRAFQLNSITIGGRVRELSYLSLDNIVMKIGKGVLNIIAILSTIIFGTIFTAVISLFHIAALIIFMCCFYIMFGFMWIVDHIYLWLNQISNVCSECKNRYTFPVYQCPNCKKLHWKLTPGKYGVLKRKCVCGQVLPCTFLGKVDGKKRSEFSGKCPICARRVIEEKGEEAIRDDDFVAATQDSKPIVIPIGGGRSAGKSVFINAFVYNFVLFSDDFGFMVDPYGNAFSPEMREKYKMIKRFYLSGTSEQTAVAEAGEVSIRDFAFYVNHKKFRVPRLMHVLDVDGESFIKNTENEVAAHLKHCNGAVLIIDPFTIPDVYTRLGINENEQSLTASVRYENAGMDSLDISLDSFTEKIRTVRGLGESERINTPLAVCIGKIDMFGLNKELGDEAVEKYMQDNADIKTKADAMNQLCKEFLRLNGEQGFLTKLENTYKEVRFFAFSAIGHDYGMGEYKPWGVMEIAEWIISMSDDKSNSKLWKEVIKLHL